MNSTTRIVDLIITEQIQILVYAGISLAVVICTGLLYAHDKSIYKPFFGDINPVVAVAIISLLGLFLLAILLSRGWFAIFRLHNVQGLAVACGLAALFSLVIVLADIKIVFPADTNRPYPQALLFYPSIGFVVEILFHVLPLTLLLVGITSFFDNLNFERIIWPTILFVALLEPIFQTWAGFSKPYPAWVTGFVALHIFLINFCQLVIFRRYDFVSMYSFRLMYYLLWHIVWGVIRLRLLF